MSWIEKIEKYTPYTKQEESDKEAILYAIDSFNNLLTRENPLAHITSSGYIVNKDKTKVLMIYHNIYNSWSWTGGHADGDEDLLYVAIKEAKEETGIKSVKPITDEICSIEILTVNSHIKRGNFVSAHLHLSVAYILEADENEELFIKEDENSGVRWIPIDEIEDNVNEEHMISIYNKLIQKAKNI